MKRAEFFKVMFGASLAVLMGDLLRASDQLPWSLASAIPRPKRLLGAPGTEIRKPGVKLAG